MIGKIEKMNVFLFGAGKPSNGWKPSVLKRISENIKVLDWHIHFFNTVSAKAKIFFIGGYLVQDIIRQYNNLSYVIVPDWDTKGILNSLRKAPIEENVPSLLCYGDTIFRPQVAKEITSLNGDIIICIDTNWRNRYNNRTVSDINIAEKINLQNFQKENHSEVELTGLIYFKPHASKHLVEACQEMEEGNFVDLVNHLDKKNLTLEFYDIAGLWAELNAPKDLAKFILGSKGDTLERLRPLLKKSKIGKQICFSFEQWQSTRNTIIRDIQKSFKNRQVIIRSNSKNEDGWDMSNAGSYKSVLNIASENSPLLSTAISKVFGSYGCPSSDEQVLVQEFLKDVKFSGVVFTTGLETGGPYFRVNFDETTGSTDSVTSGLSNDLRTIFIRRDALQKAKYFESKIYKVLESVKEIEKLLNFDRLDIEFLVSSDNVVHILQVRPITVDHSQYEYSSLSLERELENCENRYDELQIPQPFIVGSQTIFSNMSDWNPAEIIGTRPNKLAFSLYKELISEDVWAQQRAEFGYRDVRPCNLISSFGGQPYVDVRASFNSFIPATVKTDVAERLVNAYLSILNNDKSLHDKIEFDIVFTTWVPEFAKIAKERLSPYGISEHDVELLEKALKPITLHALERLKSDLKPLKILIDRRKAIVESNIPEIDKAISLLKDCKRFGTVPFAHAARAGFIANIFLERFVYLGIISNDRRLEFLQTIETVLSDFQNWKIDLHEGRISMGEIVNLYGHLRPGTYDIFTEAYWENPKKYFAKSEFEKKITNKSFSLTEDEYSAIQKVLEELGSSLNAQELFDYFKASIEMREEVKFEFTKNLSLALDFILAWGKQYSFDRDDLSCLSYSDLAEAQANLTSAKALLGRIKERKQEKVLSEIIELPSIISSRLDFYCFERMISVPNFITTKRILSICNVLNEDDSKSLKNTIVLIENSDPGFDWIFGCGISGMITKFGGANSHMAIRAAEMGLPAAIGVGDQIFEKVGRMRRIELDCRNKTIREI